MADISITAANVIPSASALAKRKRAIAGATIAAGEALMGSTDWAALEAASAAIDAAVGR